MRLVPISPNSFLNKKSQVEPVIIWCVLTKIICQFSQLCVSFATSRCGSNFDEMNENAYKTNLWVRNGPRMTSVP